jgi:hypothetical protein
MTFLTLRLDLDQNAIRRPYFSLVVWVLVIEVTQHCLFLLMKLRRLLVAISVVFWVEPQRILLLCLEDPVAKVFPFGQ